MDALKRSPVPIPRLPDQVTAELLFDLAVLPGAWRTQNRDGVFGMEVGVLI